MTLLLTIGLYERSSRGVRRFAGSVPMKSGDSGLLRMPLSHTTIQEKDLLGNSSSFRITGLFSGKSGGTGLLITLAAIIFSAVLCSAQAV